jgi:hypothetical protein
MPAHYAASGFEKLRQTLPKQTSLSLPEFVALDSRLLIE